MTKQIYAIQVDRLRVVRPNCAQFGMRNAGSLAQRASEEIFGSLDGVSAYSDEIVRSHESLAGAVDEVCELLAAARPATSCSTPTISS